MILLLYKYRYIINTLVNVFIDWAIVKIGNFMDNLKDQRYLPRWKTDKQIIYRLQQRKIILKAKVKDLSCSGVCICTNKQVSVEDKLFLKISFTKKTYLDLEGWVVWIKTFEDYTLFGIKFTNTTTRAQELLLSFAFELDSSKFVNHWFQDWNTSTEE